MFIDAKVEFNYRYQVRSGITTSIEFDVSSIQGCCLSPKIFLPDLSVAVEYNGEYHYKAVPVYLVNVRDVYTKDMIIQSRFNNVMNING